MASLRASRQAEEEPDRCRARQPGQGAPGRREAHHGEDQSGEPRGWKMREAGRKTGLEAQDEQYPGSAA